MAGLRHPLTDRRWMVLHPRMSDLKGGGRQVACGQNACRASRGHRRGHLGAGKGDLKKECGTRKGYSSRRKTRFAVPKATGRFRRIGIKK